MRKSRIGKTSPGLFLFNLLRMTWQTAYLFNFQLSWTLAGFVFSGAVCSYNFHWYLTPPVIEQPSKKLAWNISNRKIHAVLFLIGLAGAAVFSLLLIRYWVLLGITALATFLYSAPKIPHQFFTGLKKIAVGKTIYLAFAWTHVTANAVVKCTADVIVIGQFIKSILVSHY